MAGFYADPPGPRIMYDIDGTAVYWAVDSGGVGGVVTALSGASLTAMNNESEDTYPAPTSSNWSLIMIFPVAMDIIAYHYSARSGWSVSGYGPSSLERSNDTTNGIDGTWTNVTSTIVGNSSSQVSPTYRNSITSLSIANVKAIRFRGVTQYQHFRTLHLYGAPTATTNDILAFWDPVSDQALGGAALDFGDVPQTNTSTKTFRIKNMSATLTANTISISDSAPTDFSPSVPPQYEYSLDGINYSQAVNISSLIPGEISQVVTMRKTTPSNAALGLHALRVTAQASSWT